MNIVVIIPTYNEAENIGRMIDVLVGEEFPKIKNHKMHLLVVDDNSPDGTAEIVKKKQGQYKNIHLLSGEKEGLGIAYARGMRYAMEKLKADAVIEMDADFQHDPRDVKRLVAEFDEGYDYVIGSRYIKGGSIPQQWELYRKFLSWGGNMFARFVLLLLRIHDVTSGFKLTRVKGFLDKVDLDSLLSASYAYKIHLLYEIVKNRGAKAKEVPIKFHFRERGSSKIESEDVRESFKVVILLVLRSRFFKFAVVGFIGYLVNALGLEVFFRLGFSPGIAAAIGAEFAIISNFTLNNLWTFREVKITRPLQILWKFFHFNLTSAGAIVIQGVVVGVGTAIFGAEWRQLILPIAVVFFVIPYNYTMYNVFIWKTWKVPGLAWLQKRI